MNTNNISYIKWYTLEEYKEIQEKNIQMMQAVSSSVQLVVSKKTTDNDIAQLLLHLNNVSENKWYGEVELISVIDSIKQCVILNISWLSKENLDKIINA